MLRKSLPLIVLTAMTLAAAGCTTTDYDRDHRDRDHRSDQHDNGQGPGDNGGDHGDHHDGPH